jgi:diketogulonate reductase-like aldo/keto reductase
MSDTESTPKNGPANQLASERIVQGVEPAGLDGLRNKKIRLNNGSDDIPALGFGTLIPDPIKTKEATKAALETGFRQFDCAERYRNEEHVGEAMREVFGAGKVRRQDVFIGTKLWNNNHRPERVKPAFEASLKRLQLDYVDLYSIHTPFAFKPGDEQDPRDEKGNVIYESATTLTDTWKAMESLVDDGRCKAIGLSNVNLGQLKEVFDSARIKPATIQVESHPYLPEWDLLDYCKRNGIVMQAFAALGHGIEPKLVNNPVITVIAKRVNKTPAQVLLAWAVQRGTAPLTTATSVGYIEENFSISTLPDDAIEEITQGITMRVRLNPVVNTGIPGFIPKGT